MDIAQRIGRPLIQTNSYEDVIAYDATNPDRIKVKFDKIGGLDAIKQELYDLVFLPLRRPELFSCGELLRMKTGVLLYGPSGTGKTMLVNAVTKELGAVLIHVRIPGLMSKRFGDAHGLVAAVFSLAYKLQPAIIFIDDAENLFGRRKSTDHEALTIMRAQFTALWDDCTTNKHARVMVMAATNCPSQLDEAILRRLPQAFEIGLPDHNERVAILKVLIKKERERERVEDGIDYDRISHLCDGYSGLDFLKLCEKAAYYPIWGLLNDEKAGKSSSKEPRPLSQKDLERAISETNVLLQKYWSLQRESDDY